MQRQFLHLLKQKHIHFQQINSLFFHFLSRWDFRKVLIGIDVVLCFFQCQKIIIFLENIVWARNRQVMKSVSSQSCPVFGRSFTTC